MNIEKMVNDDISKWVQMRQKRGITQKAMAEITGVSRGHISNFERLKVNNMYLYNYYRKLFDEEEP